jgi:hypothetical protein
VNISWRLAISTVAAFPPEVHAPETTTRFLHKRLAQPLDTAQCSDFLPALTVIHTGHTPSGASRESVQGKVNDMRLKGSPQWPIHKGTPIECSMAVRFTFFICLRGTRYIALRTPERIDHLAYA